MKVAAILCLVLAVSVAYAQDDAEVATFGGRKARTAWDIISNTADLSTLATLIRANNLTAALDSWRNPVTVFAPTNAALAPLAAALPASLLAGPLVTNILLQHVTRSKVFVIGNRRISVPSLNPGNSITRVFPVSPRHFGRNPTTSWTGGQGNVVNSTAPGTLKAIKGQVIAINGVILPNNAFVSVQAIAAFYNYTTFANAVVGAGLLDAANSPTPQKTIFAPNNTAFAAVAGIIASLTPAQLTDALLYHVSPAIFTTPFTNTTAIPTLFTPNTLDLVAPTTVVATGSTAGVVTPNIWFPGGVFQGINNVLIPVL